MTHISVHTGHIGLYCYVYLPFLGVSEQDGHKEDGLGMLWVYLFHLDAPLSLGSQGMGLPSTQVAPGHTSTGLNDLGCLP